MMLGIDFGTSNSAVALVDGEGRLRSIPLEPGSPSMPTALFFSNESGQVFYGSAAMQAYLSGTDGRLMRSIKSLLGSSLMDEQTLVNGKLTSLFEIVVLFFKELKRRSEQHLGHAVSRAMLGRPVHFVDDDLARDALAQATLGKAALAAGFDEVQFQLEPIAAAFDFERRVTAETTVLVVDIGGGTSDFTVVRVGPDRHADVDRSRDLLATTGVHLGGTDFDRALHLRHAMPLLGLGHHGPSGREVPSSVFFNLSTWHLIQQSYGRRAIAHSESLRSDYSDRMLHTRLMHVLELHMGHQLLAATETAKIACSISGQGERIDLSGIEAGLCVPLSPEGLHEVLQGQLDAIVACARECVAASGVGRLDTVYLTGGSSALAPLQAAMQAAFPDATMASGDRFGSVAAGLAYGGAVASAAQRAGRQTADA
ncbi:heat-shock protein [Rhodoferax koreense]|uniref:Heat-shock protein n=1 Tax=Rhodoferax koreensis TaxID=1842727 RepID=A0A1P8JZU8_9BURK|nr:Hsp70 family protein [Rhodoferax koreense]APW39284.1 heat-shock protein [Rhodoferax koreense]